MNSPADPNGPEKPTGEDPISEEALEEYAVMRARGEELPAAVQEAVRGHPQSSRRLDSLTQEAQALRELLCTVPGQAEGPCPSDEAVARFLDQADSPHDRQRVQRHLSSCRACQRRLAAMFHELQAVVTTDPDAAHEPVDAVSLDERRSRPRSQPQQPPAAPVEADGVEADAPEADAGGDLASSPVTDVAPPEGRKKRYLSDTS